VDEAAVDEAFGAEIGKLDQFDAKCRRGGKAAREADQDDFDRDFAHHCDHRQADFSRSARFSPSGDLVTISSSRWPNPRGRPKPGLLSAPRQAAKRPQPSNFWLSIAPANTTRRCIRSGNVGGGAAGATGPRGDYQLAQIDTQLVEGDLLKFIRAVVAGA
jgi:hypothetical protein